VRSARTSLWFNETRALKNDPVPRGDFEAMLESEVHAIPKHAVKPNRDFWETLTCPKELPIIVASFDPDEGVFVKANLEIGAAHKLAEMTQNENAFEKLSTRVTLTLAGRSTCEPEEILTATDDEDSHFVDDEEVWDIRDAIDDSNAWEAIWPTNIKCIDPVLGDIPDTMDVMKGALKDMIAEIDPELPKHDTLSGLEIPIEDTILDAKAESEDHLELIAIEFPTFALTDSDDL